jgi:hypothetical protein
VFETTFSGAPLLLEVTVEKAFDAAYVIQRGHCAGARDSPARL